MKSPNIVVVDEGFLHPANVEAAKEIEKSLSNQSKIRLRLKLESAMNRPANPNKTPAAMAAVVGAVAGVSRDRLQKFIEGDNEAISDQECALIEGLS